MPLYYNQLYRRHIGKAIMPRRNELFAILFIGRIIEKDNKGYRFVEDFDQWKRPG
jgi:hypothetical protein